MQINKVLGSWNHQCHMIICDYDIMLYYPKWQQKLSKIGYCKVAMDCWSNAWHLYQDRFHLGVDKKVHSGLLVYLSVLIKEWEIPVV